MTSIPFNLTVRGTPKAARYHACVAAMLAALLGGCASQPPGEQSAADANAATAQSGMAPLITVPPTSVGSWVDLGHYQAPWLAGDAAVPVGGTNAPTRVAGLRREDGRWLAIVVTQRAPSGAAGCPTGQLQEIVDPQGDTCLRMRRDADFDGWLQRQNAVLYHWLDGRGWTSRPRSWVAYRASSEGGQVLEAHALLDPALLEAATRNPGDFLMAGQPGVNWARQFGAATMAAAGSGRLDVPPFPYAPGVGFAPPPPPVTAPPPARATQVTPPPRVPVQPRSDRE